MMMKIMDSQSYRFQDRINQMDGREINLLIGIIQPLIIGVIAIVPIKFGLAGHS
jgi:hypothetical protein